MRTILQKLSILFLLTIFNVSCSNNDDSSNGFFYQENGIGKKYKAYQAYYSLSFKEINVFSVDSEIMYFELTSFDVGTYNIDDNNNYLQYYGSSTEPNNTFTGNGGTLIITENSNGKISGTFNVTGSGTGSQSGITSLKGNFRNVNSGI